jgi:hypothetical protein
MTRRSLNAAMLIAIASVLAAVIVTVMLVRASAPAACYQVTQPVYATDNRNVGTWDVDLSTGESVLLPDGDTATCTSSGLSVH